VGAKSGGGIPGGDHCAINLRSQKALGVDLTRPSLSYRSAPTHLLSCFKRGDLVCISKIGSSCSSSVPIHMQAVADAVDDHLFLCNPVSINVLRSNSSSSSTQTADPETHLVPIPVIRTKYPG
jgi:hypothetical protein